MSVKTRETLENALREHLDDVTNGQWLCDWVLVAACVSPENTGTVTYAYTGLSGPPHTKLGLLDAGTEHYLGEVQGRRARQ